MAKHDYTKLPVGATDAGNTVEKCPYCNRPGLHEIVNGKDFYTHSQWVGFDEKGNPSMGFEMCPPIGGTPENKK